MASESTAAELISAYLDNRLGDDVRAEFESRLESDPEVRREVSEMQTMLRMVAGLPEMSAPPDFCEKVVKKAHRRSHDAQGLLLGLISLPFQVLSIVVIMLIAATFLMLQLERDEGPLELEKDPSAGSADVVEPL